MKKKLPKGFQILYDQGPSEEDWKDFLTCFEEEEVEVVDFGFPISQDFQRLLLITFEEEWRVKRWIESKSDLFHGYAPGDLLDNYEGGEKVIRCMMMRWPR